MILHMYNIILKTKQGSMTGPDLCSEKNYLCRSKLRKDECVYLGASPVTGQEKKRRIIRPTILNFLTCNFSCAGDFQVRQSFS